MKIPKFKTIEEERAFWDRHSVVDYLSELEETKELIFERPPLKRNFQLRLDNETIRKLTHIIHKFFVHKFFYGFRGRLGE